MSLQMWAALKSHIMRERERKKQEQEADEAIERLRREQELKRKQDAMTLEEIKDQVTQSEKKLKELKDEKHQLFMQLKKVLHEDDTRRRALVKEANEIAVAQAAANQAYAAHQGLSAVGTAPPQPLYIQNLGRAPVLYKMSSPQLGGPIAQHTSCLKRPLSPSPPPLSHPATKYQPPQFAYKAQVTAFGPKLVPYSTGSTGTQQQQSVYYTAHHIVPGGDTAAASAVITAAGAAPTIYGAGAGFASQFAPTDSSLKPLGVAPASLPPSSSAQTAQAYAHIPQAFQRAIPQQLEHGNPKATSATPYQEDKFYVQAVVMQSVPATAGGSLTTGQPVVSVARQMNGGFGTQPQIQRHQYSSQQGTRFY